MYQIFEKINSVLNFQGLDFYRMTKDDRNRIDINKSHYVIPKYQREYAWDDTMILDLINDIEDKDKFLGIIIDKGEINLFSKSISLGKILKLVVPLIDVFSIN